MKARKVSVWLCKLERRIVPPIPDFVYEDEKRRWDAAPSNTGSMGNTAT
jgi:hypothetical protein